MSRRRGLMMAGGDGTWKTTPHDLTDYQGPGFVVSQSSDQDDVRLAWRAMDGGLLEEQNESHTGSIGPNWWRIDFDKPVTIGQVGWQWRLASDGAVKDESNWDAAVKHVMLQGSDDGEAWIDVQEIEHPGVGDITVEIGDQRAFRSWRLLSLETGYLIIGELEFTYKEA